MRNRPFNFFDRKPAQEKPWTSKLWIYDLRTNQHFTLKENTLKRTDLDDLESPAVATHPLRPGFLIQSDELPRGLPQPRDQGEP